MSAPRSPLSRAATLLVMVAALVLLGAGGIDLLLGQEVTLLHAGKSPAEQAEWRRLRDPRDDPAEIYGQPEGAPLRVLVPDRTRLIVPAEAPERALLVVDRRAHDVPLQSRTLWGYAGATAVSLLLLAAVLGLIERGRRGARAGL